MFYLGGTMVKLMLFMQAYVCTYLLDTSTAIAEYSMAGNYNLVRSIYVTVNSLNVMDNNTYICISKQGIVHTKDHKNNSRSSKSSVYFCQHLYSRAKKLCIRINQNFDGITINYNRFEIGIR